MTKVAAREKLLDVVFEMAKLKDNAELFKDKDEAGIRAILYKTLLQSMPEKDKEKRFIIGKSTGASLCFSAMLAQASRIFKPV